MQILVSCCTYDKPATPL